MGAGRFVPFFTVCGSFEPSDLVYDLRVEGNDLRPDPKINHFNKRIECKVFPSAPASCIYEPLLPRGCLC